MEIPFLSSKHALIVKQVIEVDAELQPNAVKRELSVQDDKLIAYELSHKPGHLILTL